MNQRLSSIPKSLIDQLPESIARENIVIPVASTDSLLTIAADIDTDAEDFKSLTQLAMLQEKLEFILECKIQLESHSANDIQAAIDRHYSYDAQIENCSWSIENQCPQLWFNLEPTKDSDIRYCGCCSQHVYYCKSQDSVVQHASMGHCVAVYNGPTQFETIGEVAVHEQNDA